MSNLEKFNGSLHANLDLDEMVESADHCICLSGFRLSRKEVPVYGNQKSEFKKPIS
jgi:hypothetical protein